MTYIRGSAWTEERYALLAEMHKKGPKVIWEALNELPGPLLTKSMVIGKRDRLYMVRRPKRTEEDIVASLLVRRERDMAQKREKRAKAKPGPINFNRVAAAKGRVDPEPFVMRAVEVVPRHLTLLELEDGDCRFPEGDGPTYTFCGHPQMKDSPYCGKHHRLCYNGIPTPKRAGYLDLGKSSGGVFRRTA